MICNKFASKSNNHLLSVLLSSLALFASVTPSVFAAQVNLVQNGSFETTTATNSYQVNNSNLSGWQITNATGGGYTFLTFPGQAPTNVGAGAEWGTFGLWNPGGNSIPATSPDGGKFIVSDAAFRNSSIYQTINGLTVGQVYRLSFWQAAGQQVGFTGATKEQWRVSLGGSITYVNSLTLANGNTATASQLSTNAIGIATGGDVRFSTMMDNPSQGFQNWQQQQMLFTATATSQLLSFLAIGSPTGQPPFSLLDGVSLVAVPEPETIGILLFGLLVIAFGQKRLAENNKKMIA